MNIEIWFPRVRRSLVFDVTEGQTRLCLIVLVFIGMLIVCVFSAEVRSLPSDRVRVG